MFHKKIHKDSSRRWLPPIGNQLIAQLDDLCIVLWVSVLIIYIYGLPTLYYISQPRSQMKYSAAMLDIEGAR